MSSGVQAPTRHPPRQEAAGVPDGLAGLTGTTVVPPFVTVIGTAAERGGTTAPPVCASAEIPAAADTLGAQLGAGSAAVVVAAHLRGLGLLASEDEVSVQIGGVPGGADPAPTDFGLSGTWAALIADTAAALRAGSTDSTGSTTVGRVQVRSEGIQLDVDGARLTVTMASSLRDPAGVSAHLEHIRTAIVAAADDPAAAVTAVDLLTEDERGRNARLGTGEIVETLPHSLFDALEHRAREHPDRTAIVHRETRAGYRTLLTAVHTVHRAVETAGIRPGQVVAVALERSPLWIAVVLGIMRAGAVYLPLDPHDPAERRETLIRRSSARLVVDGPESLGLVASPEGIVVPRSPQDAAAAAPAVRERRPFDPAYVYFTSGSTGQPKGALCGHGGMDNHLWAKIRDFGLTDTDVVLQSAQTTFDISLWQFAAPLMVGASVLIADHAALLDVPTTLQLLAEHRVSIAQVVPSYLAILLDHLKAPNGAAALQTLRCLSVTGEAISLPITRRLFALLPEIILINAYGATEASDDTTHEIMRRAPDGPSVPVGRPNINVVVHVLDDHDRPVPPGSIGEITFSGIMVGLGYLGDAERTAAAFGPDPVIPGARLYRSGDYGRWLPTGTLQFHGRRDEQVKIAGIRLELGEIEFRLRSLAGVGEAAVITIASGDAKELAGFVTGSGPIDLDAAGAQLRLTLPAAAVPTTLVQLEALPLNGNGKVDKRALTRIATTHLDRLSTERPEQHQVGEPATPAARVLAAWAGALEIPAGTLRQDSDFFALGGTSIRALRAVAAADRLFGIADLFSRPVLGDLLALVQERGGPSSTERGETRTTEPGAAPALLLSLITPADPSAHLVFLPPAGASALIARQFAGAVAAAHPRVRVSALQHPGQSLPTDASLPTGTALVAAVATELGAAPAAEGVLPILVWGQGSGAATAIALARRTTLPVDSVFLASQPVRDRRSILRGNAVLAATADDQLAQRAADTLDVDLGALSAQDRQRLARVYRHELMQSQLDLLDDGLGVADTGAAELPVPLVLVRASDDGSAAATAADWPGATELTVTEGGPLFCRTRPELAAAVVAARLTAVARR
ncbi:MAG: non-ribosomal peptide synthetase [Nakamurella sp.]